MSETKQNILVEETSKSPPTDITSVCSFTNGVIVFQVTDEHDGGGGIELSPSANEPVLGVGTGTSEGTSLARRISRVHWLDELETSDKPFISEAKNEPATPHFSEEQPQAKRDKYEESALYIKEGEDDDKFYHHPCDKGARNAYTILHYQLYHILHFTVALLLMLLAFAENPAVGQSRLDDRHRAILTSTHATLELILLTFLGVNIVLHFIWFRSKFIRHRITLISVILVVMYVEALTVAIRQQNHIRITRILRPLFLLDTHYMTGVRTVTRQIVAILKPILDVIFLLTFFIVVFSLFGYLSFAESDPDYYSTFTTSFISLFITATTANNPDVMMESYALYKATPIFYVVYLIVSLYFASNVLLAVVFASYSEADKKKFKKLICHKRDALLQAFNLLSEETPSGIRKLQFHDFLLMMHHYRTRMPEWQAMCVFKSLRSNPNSKCGGIEWEEFLRFYDVLDFRWTQVTSGLIKFKWYSNFKPIISKPLEYIYKLVSHRFYKFFIGVLVLINLLFLVVFAIRIEDPSKRFEMYRRVLPGTFIFLILDIIDIVLNLLGYGPYNYFQKFWSLADLVMIFVSFLAACINIYYSSWAILLPLKLLRLIRLKRRYRDLMTTLVELIPRLVSIFVLIVIIYYCFAIIGMEFLFNKVEQGCCKDALYRVGEFYRDRIDNFTHNRPSERIYYLINFDNILESYVALFTLMVENNWYIIMEGFASEVPSQTRGLTRFYFIMFNIVTHVVLQVVITFIVEAFVLKIQDTAKRRICHIHPNDSHCGCPQEKKKKVVIKLVEEDIKNIHKEMTFVEEHLKGTHTFLNKCIRRWRQKRFNVKNYKEAYMLGSRHHTREDIHQIHYREEMKIWRLQMPNLMRRRSSDLEQLRKFKDKRNIRRFCTKLCKDLLDFIVD